MSFTQRNRRTHSFFDQHDLNRTLNYIPFRRKSHSLIKLLRMMSTNTIQSKCAKNIDQQNMQKNCWMQTKNQESSKKCASENVDLKVKENEEEVQTLEKKNKKQQIKQLWVEKSSEIEEVEFNDVREIEELEEGQQEQKLQEIYEKIDRKIGEKIDEKVDEKMDEKMEKNNQIDMHLREKEIEIEEKEEKVRESQNVTECNTDRDRQTEELNNLNRRSEGKMRIRIKAGHQDSKIDKFLKRFKKH